MNLQRAMIMIASLSKIGSAKLHNRNKSTRKKGQQGASSARLDKLKHILRNKSAETSLSAADTSVRATSTDEKSPKCTPLLAVSSQRLSVSALKISSP
jgi:hypothetical protein